MRPVPIAFHIGPLEVHTYGIGLALTFWFAYRYFAKRLRDNGYPDAWFGSAFVWIIVSAIVGARVVHVIANLGMYTAHPIEVFEVWNGGLASFGGLLFAFPVGLWITKKRCPELPLGRACDLLGPVLVAAWAVGRLLGPQLMIAGGGKPTTAWFGMYYADQAGKRLPVPIFQAIECFVIYLIVLQIEKWAHRRGDRPVGLVIAASATLWGASRFVDEYFWLTHDNGTDAVEIASVAFFVVGCAYMLWSIRHDDRRRAVMPPPPTDAGPLLTDSAGPLLTDSAGPLLTDSAELLLTDSATDPVGSPDDAPAEPAGSLPGPMAEASARDGSPAL